MDYKELEKKYPILYSNINDFYPISNTNIDRDSGELDFKKLRDLINQKIADSINFNKYWQNGIRAEIQKEINYPVIDLTFGYIPNYGGMIRFDENIGKNKFLVFEIQFYVSLINNFINIQVAEIEEHRTFNESVKMDLTYQKLISLTVSPSENKYNHIFIKIEKLLNKFLKRPIFLPYELGNTILDGLVVPHSYKNENKIEDVFFSKKAPINLSDNIIGDVNYGIEKIY